jgi:type IX secretion system PorP/SprF family membrane protein
MHIRKLLSLFFGVLAAVSLQSQDTHFTQYFMTPMSVNPANTGNFEGTVRVGGIYRGQWWNLLGGQQYRTPSAYLDFNLKGFRKQDWISLGLMLFQDKSGALGLVHSGGTLCGAYHFALDKRGNTVLTLGVNYGGEQRKFSNSDNGMFEDAIKSGMHTLEMLASTPTKYKNIDGGLLLTSKINKMTDFNIGFAMYHINKANYSVVNGAPPVPPVPPAPPTQGSKGNAKIPIRSIFHGQFNAKLSPRFTLSPSFFYQTMNGLDEIELQAMGAYLFDPAKEITIDFGAGYRLRDAVSLIVGFRQKTLRVGLAYDVTTSQLANYNKHQGAFELAASYIFKIYKPAVITPQILCPRF